MDAYEEHYKPLEGFTILTYLGMSEEEHGDGFPQFLISNGKEDLVVEVSRDPEGNGGGFLFINGRDE